MTALSPGASPPPVEMATRIALALPAASVGHQPEDLSGLRVSSQRLLGEHELAVNHDLEHAARRLDELHSGLRVRPLDLGRQTGGPGLVPSDDAVLDAHPHGTSLPE